MSPAVFGGAHLGLELAFVVFENAYDVPSPNRAPAVEVAVIVVAVEKTLSKIIVLPRYQADVEPSRRASVKSVRPT
jgi:hypothetical protein